LLKKFVLLLLTICLAASCGFAADQQKAKKTVKKQPPRQERRVETRDAVYRKLEGFAASHVQKLNRNLRPNSTHITVTQEKDRFCAWYLQIDPATIKVELSDTSSVACRYVGHIIYHEHRFVSYGKTRKEALAGRFKEAKTWRKREIARYEKRGWCF